MADMRMSLVPWRCRNGLTATLVMRGERLLGGAVGRVGQQGAFQPEHAFAGLSNYLIARKHFSAQEVASVIALVDGCGGKD